MIIFQTSIVKRQLELGSLWNWDYCLDSWLEMYFCKNISICGEKSRYKACFIDDLIVFL